jgi:serine/threonine protein kinase
MLAAVGDPSAADPLIGRRLGDFVILRRIGAGGMGAVYEARQEQPHRRVAVKVLRPGFATPPAIRRFEYESEVLARLRHPGIASVYAAGTFNLGDGEQPWFAMELIDGPPLSTYASGDRLSPRRKIELMIEVCDAVQHAHQQGVIHRDLKPGNILVADQDEGHSQQAEPTGGGPQASHPSSDFSARYHSAMPKVLDFGVARVIGADVQATLLTATGELVGTLSYMSPEQLSANSDQVDARSDVFALGVIGFELLAGRLPHHRTGTPALSPAMVAADIIRAIEREEPARLGALDPRYRGDLETIFAKALEKNPTRRYQSASELAGDLRRYLNNEPVLARPATALYQLRKFARRNRALVAGVAAVILALSAGVFVATVFAVRESKARAEAEEARTAEVEQRHLATEAKDAAVAEAEHSRYEADKATAINNFITNDFVMKLLAAANNLEAGQRLPVADLVDRAAANVSAMFAEAPLAEAAVRNEVATIYYNLSAFDKAAAEFELALTLWESKLGPDHPDTLKAVNNLGQCCAHLGRNEDAERLYRRAYEGRLRALGEDNPYTLVSMNNLANLLRWTGRLDEAEEMFRRTLQVQRRVHGDSHKNTLITLANLGVLVLQRGNVADALQMHREAYERSSQTLGAEHVTTLSAGSRLSQTLLKANAVIEAEELQSCVVAFFDHILGPNHRDTIHARRVLARVYQALEQSDKAREQLGLALAGAEQSSGRLGKLQQEIQEEIDELAPASGPVSSSSTAGPP